jgi:ABC-type polysaccharide/polyol phosphate export permease
MGQPRCEDTMNALWLHRRLIWETAVGDLRYRYAGSALGVFWNVLTPLVMLTLYALIFTHLLAPGVSRAAGAGAFVLYLASGFLPWGAFADCIIRGTNSLVANATYLKKLPVPEQVFVAQAAVTATLGMLIALALIGIAAPILGEPPDWTWLFLPFVAILWQTFGFGVGLVLGTLNVFFRDTAQVVGVALQIWMWSLPIVYLEEFLPDAYRNLLVLNPAYPFVKALREIFLNSQPPEPWLWGAMVLWPLVAGCVGLLVLGALRAEIRDVI